MKKNMQGAKKEEQRNKAWKKWKEVWKIFETEERKKEKGKAKKEE